MKKELEHNLFEKYPKIFDTECWAIECGDGWYDLIDELCGDIQFYVDSGFHNQIRAVQVKQKFGSLRFYTDDYDETLKQLIHKAEERSLTICEMCGMSEPDVKRIGSWIQTLCQDCRKKSKNE